MLRCARMIPSLLVLVRTDVVSKRDLISEFHLALSFIPLTLSCMTTVCFNFAFMNSQSLQMLKFLPLVLHRLLYRNVTVLPLDLVTYMVVSWNLNSEAIPT